MADPTLNRIGAGGEIASGGLPGALNAHLLKEKLAEAELLLSYAVEHGFQVDSAVTRGIIEAGSASRTGWTEQAATNLLTAESTLAAMLKPVSAESLQNTARYRSNSLMRRLALPASMVILAAAIVLYSTGAFLFSAFSTKIRDNIATANPLAVKLFDELGSVQVSNAFCPNGGTKADSQATGNIESAAQDKTQTAQDKTQKKYVVADLQAFAAAIRDMYGAAKQLNRLPTLFSSKPEDPIVTRDSGGDSNAKNKKQSFGPDDYAKALELPAGLPDLAQAATERICVYQRVRYYAQSTEDDATIFTGAVAAGILPVLYALLGAGAYMLRRLESQLRSRTFIKQTYSPRFITATIAGAVVGLFNFGQGVSVSPLAIAFLAGYAVDVFFALLENMIQSLSKGRGGTGSDQSAEKN